MAADDLESAIRAVVCDSIEGAEELRAIAADRGLTQKVAAIVPADRCAGQEWGERRHFPARLPNGTLGVAAFQ
eukprot:12990913-Alexandrium_andersonii.AAC.1